MQDTLNEISRRVNRELNEIKREINIEIKYVNKNYYDKSLNMERLANTSNAIKWASGLFGTILAFTPLIIVGIAVGVGGQIVSSFMGSRTENTVKAVKQLESKLYNHIDKIITDMRASCMKNLAENIIYTMKAMQRNIKDTKETFLELSKIQQDLAYTLNERFIDVNKTTIKWAMNHLGKTSLTPEITKAIRVPGYAIILLVRNSSQFPNEIIVKLRDLFQEKIRLIDDNEYTTKMLTTILGNNVDYSEITITKFDGRPFIANVPFDGNIDVDMETRISLAQQATKLIIKIE
jgi:hypothetical protein